MSVYSIIYMIIAALLMIYIIKNRLDLMCIAAVCFIVYSMYCIPGIGISGQYRPQLSPLLYFCIYSQMLIFLFLVMWLRGREKRILPQQTVYPEQKAKECRNKNLDYAFYVYTGIITLFALVNVVSIGFSGFSAGKALVWEESNILYIISLYGAYPAFAYGIHNRKKLIWIPSLLIELTIFFAGARAFAATLIILFLCERGTELWKNRKGNMKIYALGAAAVVFLLMYRMVDQSIMAGNFDKMIQTLSNPAAWFTALEFNEPRVIIANYDYVLTHGVKFPLGDTLYRIFDFIPGLSSLLPFELEYPEYFSTWLMEEVQASAGVGGTIWGEGYAMFGILGIPLLTALWVLFIWMCNKHLTYPEGHSYFIVALGTYLAWYINRLDFNRVGQACKVMFLCFLMWAAVYLLIGGTIRQFKSYRIYFRITQ